MKEPNIIFFDIEVSPCLAWVWTTGKQYVGPHNILDPTRIICITWTSSLNNKVHEVHWDDEQKDKDLLIEFSKVAATADALIGHNGKAFDIKHINARLAYHDLDPLPITKIEDTLVNSRKVFKLPSHRLDYLAKYFGIGKKIDTDFQLWLDVTLKNDRKALKKMLQYGKHDSVLLKQVYERIKKYIPSPINRAVYANDPTLCPHCGHNSLQKRGYLMTGTGKKQRSQCQCCGKWCTSGMNLVAGSSVYPR